MKKILFYCQYHLGMGHLVRSVEIMRDLAREFQICFVKGGTTVDGLSLPENIEVVTLPTLLSENRQVKVADPSQDLETIKQQRTALLLQVFERFQPDCLTIEGYPFKKYQFEFEAIPLLERVRVSQRPVKVVCSLRDVVMAQPYLDRNEAISKTCQRLNQYFDLLLVHSDPQFHRLEESFPAIADIHCPIQYTGFVAQSLLEEAMWTEQDVTDFSREQPMILVSVGGGQLGHDLLEAVIAASPILKQRLPQHHLQVFTGPFMLSEKFLTLQQAASGASNLTLRQFTPNLLAYMQKASLSISLGGYNTTMNILRTGVNAMILPSSKDWEQTVRTEKLQKMGILRLLQPEDRLPERLADRIVRALEAPCSIPPFTSFDLQGAEKTTALLKTLMEQPVAAA
ncbi:glycosyltransferase family protein [Altericista sp. CCNU0014]|uniref:glycosyltransferase family protein n=1 Tax=Altericista sp. CCNU0014 TaxID=3082949 RepID=UPI00384A9D63